MRKHEKSQYFCLQCIAVIFGRQKKQSSALSPLTLWWKNMIRPMLSASMTTLVKYSVAQPTVHNLLKRFDKLWQEMERDLTVHRSTFCQSSFWWIYYYGSNKSETVKSHLCACSVLQKKGLQIKRNWSKPSHLDHSTMFCTVQAHTQITKFLSLDFVQKMGIFLFQFEDLSFKHFFLGTNLSSRLWPALPQLQGRSKK